MENIKLFSAAFLAACSMAATAQVTDGNSGLIGFANYRDMGLQGTTGGGQGEVVRVSTREQLAQYAGGNTPRTIIIENDITGNGNIGTGAEGKYDFISVGSNKTIVGAGKGVTLTKVGFDIKNQQNVIFRNLRIKDCNPDALAFRNTHHVWVDHCDLASCADGLLDFTLGSSYLSVSWTKFSNHDKVSICNSGTNHFEDNGRQRATYHHCQFVSTTQRNPRFGYGLGHVFNNFYTDNSSYCVGYHTRAKAVVENSLFRNTHSPLNQMYSDDPTNANYADCLARGNKYEGVSGNTKDTGTGFDISRYYAYLPAMQTADEVEAMIPGMGLADGIENDIIPFPGNYATDVLNGCKLQAGAIYGATAYSYKIGREGEPMAAYDAATTALQPATEYAWTATAATPDGNIESATFHFTTAAEKASKPLPEDGERHAKLYEALADNTPCTPLKLRWRSGFSAKAYRVYLAEGTAVGDNDFIGETEKEEIGAGQLKYGQQYAWRVDAVNEDGSVAKGDTWTFSSDKTEAFFGRTEMENAQLSGCAYIEHASEYRSYSGGNAVVGEAGPGAMSVVWAGDDADCDITTTYFDWQKANSTYALYVNSEKKDSWIMTVDGKNMSAHTSKSIRLKRGDEIRIDFCTNGKQRVRTDCIDIAKAASTGITDISADDNAAQLRVFTIDGRFVGNSIHGLPSGIYIVNGKKVVM